MMQAWLQALSTRFLDFLFDLDGHLGSQFATSMYTLSETSVTFPSSFNNANAFVKKTPYQLLFQNSSLLASQIAATFGSNAFSPFPQEIGLMAAEQRIISAELDPPNVFQISTASDSADAILAYGRNVQQADAALTIYGSLSEASGAAIPPLFCNPFASTEFSSASAAQNVSDPISQIFNGLPTLYTPVLPAGGAVLKPIQSDSLKRTASNDLPCLWITLFCSTDFISKFPIFRFELFSPFYLQLREPQPNTRCLY